MQRAYRPSDVPFDTTADAETLAGVVVGQDRAVRALKFGVGIRRHGYNLFAIGPAGIGKHTLVRQYLQQQAAREKTPSDWCLVHNFDDSERPRTLELPPGMGARLAREMTAAVAELRTRMRSAFESEEYRTRKQKLVSDFKERQERALAEVQEQAKQRDVAVVSTDSGIAIAALRNGVPMDAEHFKELPREEREQRSAEMERVSASLHGLLRKFHEWHRQHQETLQSLDREFAASVARRVLDGVRVNYPELPAVLEHLARIELDVVDSADQFLEGTAEGVEATLRRALRHEQTDGSAFRRYQVNVLVDRSDQRGAPVVYEDNPTYADLVGRIEHESQFGTLIANFMLIRAGALHRSLGGYLILDALKVLQHPFAWDAVKRVIRSGEVRIESLGHALGLVPTVTLEPAPIPLGSTKVVLTGDRILYYLLAALDPDFLELFKVLVDFEDTMERSPATERTYAHLIATLVATEDLRPFDRTAVARVIDFAARAAGDAEKLSVHMRQVVDLLGEADFWAAEKGRDTVIADDVQTAIDAQLERASRVRERQQEAVRRDDILIATAGESVGQINGLSAFQLGEHLFGQTTRITARVRLGRGEVVDIEREVELGGPIHSKGVLILGGYLGSRYAAGVPLSLSATLVFEQSYGAVEGDSASLAELCALVSALADAPIKQALAVTGSVNQQGQIQAIGAVNQKIEGFFDICGQRGLTGEHGVLIPRSNAKNLMLRRDVIDAIHAGMFHIYAVEQVDDAIELLTGRKAGARDHAGQFPEGSINRDVDDRLIAFAERARMFMAEWRGKKSDGELDV